MTFCTMTTKPRRSIDAMRERVTYSVTKPTDSYPLHARLTIRVTRDLITNRSDKLQPPPTIWRMPIPPTLAHKLFAVRIRTLFISEPRMTT